MIQYDKYAEVIHYEKKLHVCQMMTEESFSEIPLIKWA